MATINPVDSMPIGSRANDPATMKQIRFLYHLFHAAEKKEVQHPRIDAAKAAMYQSDFIPKIWCARIIGDILRILQGKEV